MLSGSCNGPQQLACELNWAAGLQMQAEQPDGYQAIDRVDTCDKARLYAALPDRLEACGAKSHNNPLLPITAHLRQECHQALKCCIHCLIPGRIYVTCAVLNCHTQGVSQQEWPVRASSLHVCLGCPSCSKHCLQLRCTSSLHGGRQSIPAVGWATRHLRRNVLKLQSGIVLRAALKTSPQAGTPKPPAELFSLLTRVEHERRTFRSESASMPLSARSSHLQGHLTGGLPELGCRG